MTHIERCQRRAIRLRPQIIRAAETAAAAIVANIAAYAAFKANPAKVHEYLSAAAAAGVAEARVEHLTRIIACQKRPEGRARTKAELARWDAQQHEKMSSRA